MRNTVLTEVWLVVDLDCGETLEAVHMIVSSEGRAWDYVGRCEKWDNRSRMEVRKVTLDEVIGEEG